MRSTCFPGRRNVAIPAPWIEVDKMSLDNPVSLSFCTAVMNRLQHIQQTYPRNLQECEDIPNLEFVLLNFNCQQGTDEWVRTHLQKYIDSGQLNYFHEKSANYFHMSIAKNLAYRLSRGTVVANLDADSYLTNDIARKVLNAFASGKVRIATGGKYRGGMPIVRRSDFFAVNGYDEAFTGWGYEEIDLFHRISKYREIANEEVFVYRGIHQIRHGHRLRLANMNTGYKVNPLMTNRLNRAASETNIKSGKLVAKPFSFFVVYKNLSAQAVTV